LFLEIIEKYLDNLEELKLSLLDSSHKNVLLLEEGEEKAKWTVSGQYKGKPVNEHQLDCRFPPFPPYRRGKRVGRGIKKILTFHNLIKATIPVSILRKGGRGGVEL